MVKKSREVINTKLINKKRPNIIRSFFVYQDQEHPRVDGAQ